ncbi:MAG: glycosyltransferase family 4 protein [Magnetococcales bacterium]|nr:glycosyltransferase family 4 protein [Magnetococcales bacterium]
MTPLRMLHTESSLGWGGQEIRILTESAGFVQRGHSVKILAPRQSNIFKVAGNYGVEAVPCEMGGKNIPSLRATIQTLREHPADILLSHSSTDSWLGAIATRFISTPPPIIRVRHVSTGVPTNWPTRWLYSRAARHIVTTGEMVREQMIRVNGFPPEQITSIPTGIDREKFKPGDQLTARKKLGLPESGLIVGMVATMRSWKGHKFLLPAFAQMQDQQARLLLVGDGPVRGNIERQIAELNLKERVILVGNQENVPPWLQAMDLFVLPSYGNEGIPQGLMQGMLTGLPVITTRVGGIPEIVEDGQTGILLSPKDVPSLTNALNELLSHHERRQQMGRNALQVAQERFGLEIMLDRMEEIIRRIIAAP